MNHHAAPPPRHPRLGLQRPPEASAARIEQHWRAPVVLALVATIPAFYVGLVHPSAMWAARFAYALAALVTGTALAHTAWRCARPRRHLAANMLDPLLIAGLLASALAPPSVDSTAALVLRLVAAGLTLARLLWALQQLLARGSLAYLMLVALGVLLLCGAGFWWLEPSTPTLADGLWLAFTTAATVGYGDVVPTTAASKIFAVFVVLLGFGVLTMATAAIATAWIGSEERRIEREILHDLRQQLAAVHADLSALRAEVRRHPDDGPTER